MPGAATIENEEVQTDSRRAAIEAAFTAAENPDPGPVDKAPPQDGTSAPRSEKPAPDPTPGEAADKPVEGLAGEEPPAEEEDTGPKFSVDKPPQSWRGPQKAKWAALDPDIRQEVIRREREVTTVLNQSADARKLASVYQQVTQPFAARFQAMKVHPLAAIQELLRTDHILTTAPKNQKAALVAKLIADYEVDVEALDLALSGQPAKDPVNEQVERLVEQRLQPFKQFMTRQQQLEQQQLQEQDNQFTQKLNEMAADTVKYPHFADLKGDMADIIEFQAKKGVYLSLEQAYNRAIAMNPDLSQSVTLQANNDKARQSAQAANARAQKALKASSSVSGAPNGPPVGAPPANDRRATISAAFDAASGR
jgi:hypothetical protein